MHARTRAHTHTHTHTYSHTHSHTHRHTHIHTYTQAHTDTHTHTSFSSNLTFVSKLLEHIVCTQLKVHLESNSAFPEHQSAYRKFHSTESVLLKVYADLNMALGKGHIALLGLLDLSAAFDTVDHDILLKRLEVSFGVCVVHLSNG